MTAEARATVWPDDLLSAGDLACVALEAALELAASMKREAHRWRGALEGEVLACFFDPQTLGGTATAAAAAERLGMQPVVLPRDELEPGRGELLDDAVHTVSATATALVVHGFPHRALERVAAAATVPVINALSEEHRPCQALADLLTLRERFGRREGLAVAFLGDGGSGAAHSLMEAGARAAMDVRIACPAEHRPSPLIQPGAETFAALHGGRITVTDDVHEAVQGVQAIYTAPWAPPGREAERADRVARLKPYRVDPVLMNLAGPRAVLLHCLPVRRGDEVAPGVVDGPRSVVWQQAANRRPAEQAVIFALVSAAVHRNASSMPCR
jgi:ornithine carbamoyltransferase